MSSTPIFTHDQVWGAIDLIAEQNDISVSRLAIMAGFDATAFNKSKRIAPSGRPRWPTVDTIISILFVSGTSWNEFGMLMEMHARIAAIKAEAA